MTGFHISRQTFFQLARFPVLAIAVNQIDKRFRMGCAPYQRLYNMHKTPGINVADAAAQPDAAHDQYPVHLR
jgi:hypothetical protein